MKNLFKISKSSFSVVLSVLASVFLVSVVVFAASTIDLNISTGGTLSVTGQTILGNATSSLLTVSGNAFWVGTEATTPWVGIKSGEICVDALNCGTFGSSLVLNKSGGTSFRFSGSTRVWRFNYDSSGINFENASDLIYVLNILNAGGVGIGTTTPGALLGVNGDILGAGKLSISYVSATSTTASSTFQGLVVNRSLAVANNVQAAGILNITGSGTSTFAGGITAGNGLILSSGGLRVSNITGCDSLDTDAIGNLVCGTDATGGGGAINSGTSNRLAYYSGATTLDSANGFIVDAAKGSTTVATNIYASTFYATSTTATSTFKGGLLAAIGGGNVGIGAANPAQMLELATGNIIIDRHPVTGNLTRSEYIGITDISGVFGDDLAGAKIKFESVADGGNSSQSLHFITHHTGVNAGIRMTIDKDGKVGIGTTTPGTAFGVTGAGVFTGPVTAPYFLATSTSATSTFSGGLSVLGTFGVGTSSPWGRLSITGVGASSDKGFVFADSGNITKFVIQNDGKVGIGVSNPQTTLEVNGTASTTELRVSGTAGIGTSTPAKEFSVVGDSYQSSNATTTLFIKSTGSNRNGCIELEGPSDVAYRLYIKDSAGTPSLWVEAGTCK